jgi:O-methyltransferase
MRAILKAYGEARAVWVADSFAGLPPPSLLAYAADAGDEHHTFSAWLACSQQQVETNFARYGVLSRGWSD